MKFSPIRFIRCSYIFLLPCCYLVFSFIAVTITGYYGGKIVYHNQQTPISNSLQLDDHKKSDNQD